MTDAAPEKPPLFAAEGLAAAGARALAAGRWLILDATARWCQPCKLMDRTTWRDPGVEAWIAAHAVAIQVDVDAEEDAARELAIGAMPTVIAFRDGKEQDRVVGYRTAAALLQWLAGLERGESSIDQLRRSVPDPERDMQGRLRLAQALLHARRLDEAAGEYVWLWHNIARVEPGMRGVRVSFMASAIATLVDQHAGARAQFTAIRDGAEAQAGRDGADRDARYDWLVLNEVLGDDERTVAWFDAVKVDAVQADVVEQVAHRLVPKLQQRERWADIGRIYRDPLAELRSAHELIDPEGVAPEMVEQIRGFMTESFRKKAALLVTSLRAAGRNEEAAAVETEALRLDPGDPRKVALAAAPTTGG